ncbi:MAG: hypothetical protein SynsKO_34560 [Synoicihabitans sp.]
MIIFRPTLSLAKALKQRDLADEPAATRPLNDWCVRSFRVRRTAYLIFTDSLSLYSLITPQRGITNVAKLRQAFATLVHTNFNHPTLGSTPASDILKRMTDCRIARNRDRRVLGSMTDLVWNAQYHLDYGDSLAATIANVNEAPMGQLKMNNPTCELAEQLAAPFKPLERD